MTKIIKISRKDDLTSVVRQIKTLADKDLIFDVEKGSVLLANAEGMRLMKKTGEVLGKTIQIQTNDPAGQAMARKAGVLVGEAEVKPVAAARTVRADIKTSNRFSDIKVAKRPNQSIRPQSQPMAVSPSPSVIKKTTPTRFPAPMSRTTKTEAGSRLEIEVARKSSKFSKIFILCLVVLVVAVFGLAVLLPKADVTVSARSEPISRDFELTVDRSVVSADANSLQIPGIPVSKEVSVTKTFQTTGVKVSGTKTGGEVTIYNFTSNTLTLKKATTTLVVDGKKYLFVKDVSGIKPNGVPNPGIQIAAEAGGSDYNLPANTKMQIVNAALGNANVYAMNPQALGGGSTVGQTKIVSQQDLDNAQNTLSAGVVDQAASDLTAEMGSEIKLLPAAVKKDILAKTANKSVGDEADSFDMTLIAKITGLAFKEDNLISVLVSKINEVLSSDKYLLDNREKNYTADFKSIDLTSGRGVLTVHFETIAAYKVDTDNLPKLLGGKTESEIKEILLSKPEIDKVDVKFWPSWFVHKAPKFNGKINIDVVLSQN